MFAHHKKRTTEVMSNLIKDVAEIGTSINSDFELNVIIL